MKKLFKSFILLVLVIFVTSCTNEDFNNETANNDNTKMLQRNSFCSDIDKLTYHDNQGRRKEILVFTGTDGFFNQTDCLEELEDRYEDEFLNTVPPNISEEEELNGLDEEYGFNEYQVYLDFNSELEFTSLLHEYIEAEIEYLNTEELPEELDPDVLFFGLEEPEMAILNIDKAYMVKNKQHQFIIVFYVDGILIITDGSINTLNEVANHDTIADIDGIEKMPNVQVLDPPPTFYYCVTTNTERDHFKLSSKKRIKGVSKLKAHAAAWFDDNNNGVRDPSPADSYITIVKNKIKVKAKTIKKRFWGGWWRYRVGYIKAALGGIGGQGDCVGDVEFDENTHKTYKRNRAKVKYNFVAPNGTVNGIHVSDDKLWGYYTANNKAFKMDIYNGNGEIVE